MNAGRPSVLAIQTSYSMQENVTDNAKQETIIADEQEQK